MSRKSQRNATDPASAKPPAPAAAETTLLSRRNLFVLSSIALLLAFVVAMLIYKSDREQPATTAIPQALVSEQSPTFGPADAKVHIVEFVDPACETCAVFFPHAKKLLESNPGRVRLTIRHVAFHQGSEVAVRILEASRAQNKYLATLEALYAAQERWVVNHVVQGDLIWGAVAGVGLDLEQIRREMNTPEITRRVEADMGAARQLGVTKTPEFFVNGRPLPRFGLEPLQNLVQEELRRAYP